MDENEELDFDDDEPYQPLARPGTLLSNVQSPNIEYLPTPASLSSKYLPIQEELALGLDVEPYQPLERPSCTSAPVKAEVKPEIDDDYSSTGSISDSDSDEDTSFKKRVKLDIKQNMKERKSLNKYEVWSNRAQEDSLLENFNNCDVAYVDRSRNVESYEYIPPDEEDDYHFNDSDQKPGKFNNRKRKQGYNKNGGKKDQKDILVPRHIPELSDGYEDKSDKDLATEIADKLLEEKEDLVCKIVTVLGRAKAIKLFNDVRKIESEGGMFVLNQSRKRTPGGVYITLVKQDDYITKDQRDLLFKDEAVKYREQLKAKKRLKVEKLKKEIQISRAKMIANKNLSSPN